VRAAALLLALLLALSGCETNAEKSAKLERVAHSHVLARETGLTVSRQNPSVKVVQTTVLRGAEGAAAVVTLRNISPKTLRDVPLAITVKDAGGRTVFQNNAPGLEAALTSLALLPAHGEATWIDDQVPASGAPASVSAIAGVAPVASGTIPPIEVLGVHPSEESGSPGAAGTVHNRSNVTQQNLVVYVLARRAGRIVAAGRALLSEVATGASVPFQAFLVGAPMGATLEASAPPTTD
jgi:hypothetical protein